MIQGNDASITRGSIQSGPFRLGYSIEGNGPVALVIGSAKYYSRTFSAELRQHLQLVFVDHRAFAPADKHVSVAHFDLQTVLADMERVRQELGLGRVIVIGHSGHGYMALEYAKRHPQNVSHVVMIATGPSHSDAQTKLREHHWNEALCPRRKALHEKYMSGLDAAIAADPAHAFVTFCVHMSARTWFDPEFDPSALWEGVHVNMTGFDHLWGEAFRDLDITNGLAGMKLPVLLALGRFDYLVSPHYAWDEYREHFHDLTLRVFDRSAHSPQLEESEVFDQLLLDWLQQTASQEIEAASNPAQKAVE